MKVIAFIFARGGSKGLPDKNIMLLQGKPLIAWSIEQALETYGIERVIVSTDSKKIAEIAIEFGAEVPFMRPHELAMDDSPEWLAWRHALNYVKENEGVLPDCMVSVPTTSPLRLPLDIENCLKEYNKGKADVVVTICEAHRNPYFNMVRVDKDGAAELVNKPEIKISRRQDAEEIYDLTTVAYVVRPGFVFQHSSIFEGSVSTVEVPRERAIDIDNKIDFEIADFLMGQRLQNII
jgi:CMP-N-acetylneuraminic acid synthetase